MGSPAPHSRVPPCAPLGCLCLPPAGVGTRGGPWDGARPGAPFVFCPILSFSGHFFLCFLVLVLVFFLHFAFRVLRFAFDHIRSAFFAFRLLRFAFCNRRFRLLHFAMCILPFAFLFFLPSPSRGAVGSTQPRDPLPGTLPHHGASPWPWRVALPSPRQPPPASNLWTLIPQSIWPDPVLSRSRLDLISTQTLGPTHPIPLIPSLSPSPADGEDPPCQPPARRGGICLGPIRRGT